MTDTDHQPPAEDSTEPEAAEREPAEPTAAEQPAAEPATPEPAEAGTPATPGVTAEDSIETAPTWPFAAYLAVWIGFSVMVVWRFYATPIETPLFDLESYRAMVIAGIVLTAAGPLLSLTVWLIAGLRPDARRGAVFISALFKGAVTTFAGVLSWWIAMLILDQLRFGSLL